MNLRWNPNSLRFEADFHDFQTDLTAVKAAKFKCDGPPTWVWHTIDALALKYLREHKPPILTITQEARAEYERLLPIAEKSAEVKAALAVVKKAAKKERAKAERQAEPVELRIPEKGYIGAEDLSPMPPFVSQNAPCLVRPIGTCRVCKGFTYDPEINDLCLWCDKVGDEAF